MPYCPNCGKDHPYNQTVCAKCGYTLAASPAATVTAAYAQGQPYVAASAGGAREDRWQTSIAGVLLGLLAIFLAFMFIQAVAGDSSAAVQIPLCGGMIAYMLAGMFYVGMVYPGLFGKQGVGSFGVSFANVFFAGPLGFFMNGSLSKGKRGVAHVLYMVFQAIMLATFVAIIAAYVS